MTASFELDINEKSINSAKHQGITFLLREPHLANQRTKLLESLLKMWNVENTLILSRIVVSLSVFLYIWLGHIKSYLALLTDTSLPTFNLVLILVVHRFDNRWRCSCGRFHFRQRTLVLGWRMSLFQSGFLS